MKKVQLTEETRYGLFFLLGLIVVVVVMLLMSLLLGGNSTSMVEKEKDKTVLLKQITQSGEAKKAPSKEVVDSVRKVVKQNSYSTTHMEIGEAPKTAAESQQLSKQLAEDSVKQKAPGIRKEKPLSPNTPVRFYDESTPRDRASNAVYIYFIDLSGALWPRFCAQNVSRKALGITRFIITADNKKIELPAPSVSHENNAAGVAEWYDAPLDKASYDAAQAIIKAKKATITAIGSKDKTTRDISKAEKEAFATVLKGFSALGGNLSYMAGSANTPATPPAKKKQHP
jgi:hypothetical protein